MENDFALHGHMQISPRSSLFGKNQPFLTGLPSNWSTKSRRTFDGFESRE
jgi:hypothetical protein